MNRRDFRGFLCQLNLIDGMLIEKIGIDLAYAEEMRHNRRRLQLYKWMGFAFSMFWTAVPVILYGAVSIILFFGLLACYKLILIFEAIPMYLLALHYYRVVTYIEAMNRRYRLINRFIYDFAKHRSQSNTFEMDAECMKIYDLREVCQMLCSTCREVNRLFQWSFLLTTFNDFANFTLFIYFFLRLDRPYIAIVVGIRIIPRLVQLISFASVCELTTLKVRSIVKSFDTRYGGDMNASE